jgi:NADH-quinone oxidoreductase subunit F
VNLKKEVHVGRRVGIIGGGNAAVDAARVALRLEQCEDVHLIYRRTRKEMPAFEEEVEALLEEGAKLQFLTAPNRVLTENGRMAGLECVRMELGEPDESGRRRPVKIEGSEFVVELDTLLVAIGEQADVRFLGRGHDIEISDRSGTIVCEDTTQTSRPGVFAGGDVVTGPDTVIEAMAAGKVAAEMIDRYIRGECVVREYDLLRPSRYVTPVELTEEEAEHADRPPVPHLPLTERLEGFAEVDQSITEAMAVLEARRCLRCDLQTTDAKRELAQLQPD